MKVLPAGVVPGDETRALVGISTETLVSDEAYGRSVEGTRAARNECHEVA